MSVRARQLVAMVVVAAIGVTAVWLLVRRIVNGPDKRSGHAHEPGRPITGPLEVPEATGEVHIDGHLSDKAWKHAATTGAFMSGGGVANPYSDVRLLRHGGTLYVGLYAADDDIAAPIASHDEAQTGDSFQLVFRRGESERTIDVSPRGAITDGERIGAASFDTRWESHAAVAVDRNGTLDDATDQDEEWIVEMAIPFASLGLDGQAGERIGFEVKRCDVARADGGAARTCVTWGGERSELVLR